MGALSRELPAAAWRRDGGEACKTQRCVVCLCDVEKVETAEWLPACMHVFHRHCIERWLHDHSTCPICRAFVAAAVESETL
ncbi:hypothetical protein HU200_050509 [Digitaria exilis]|uniref:RING-type E3 ubiquitin transferase n=1 Tax=Digitaria exilis TaxID=1010633 RepID=A0A835ARA7_9POAL|nr:hypothetical protein HU200_050509 [Digitaria exilis]